MKHENLAMSKALVDDCIALKRADIAEGQRAQRERDAYMLAIRKTERPYQDAVLVSDLLEAMLDSDNHMLKKMLDIRAKLEELE